MTIKYDFDEEIDRSQSSSNKWEKYRGKDVLPMWVADTDFRAAPAIVDAIKHRADHGVFGYTHASSELKEIVVERMQRLYQWKIEADWIVWFPGVVAAINLFCRSFSKPGDSVYTAGVVYHHIPEAVKLSARQHQAVPMCLHEERMVMDLDWLAQQKSKAGQILVLCNPQNPGGAIYRRAELQQLADIAEQQDLIICSDEIHCDLVLDKDKKHIPIASLNSDIEQRSITLMGASKSFNLAGMGCSYAIVPNRAMRKSLKDAAKGIMPWVNIMGFAATQAAYQSSGEWLRQQLEYLSANRDLLIDQVNQIPGLKMGPLESTYLAWIEVSQLGLQDPMTFFENAGVGMSAGRDFGDNEFMRLNFGCPRERVQQAIDRMRDAIATRS